MNHSEIVSFVWGVADLIRDTFRRGHYQDVILPLTVLRRLDCVLADTKERVLARQAELQGRGLQDLQAQLRRAAGFAFYNTSRYDFDKLHADPPHLAANLRNYIAGFSQNMREVIERFDFDNTISKLDEAGLLFQVLERFKNVNLHPDRVDNPTMGMIFEELIRRFNEALNENPGEHFTPRDVVHLMVDLMLAGDEDRIRRHGVVSTADLEKLYVFARHLRRLLPPDKHELPIEVQQNIDMESYRIQQTGSGKIALDRKAGILDPVGTKSGYGLAPEEVEALSRIIAELNERFGLNLGPEHRVTLAHMMEKLDADVALEAAARVNTRENVRLTFDHKVENVIQEIVETNFDLYKRITDDDAFGEALKNFLFDQYVRGHRNAEELIKRGEFENSGVQIHSALEPQGGPARRQGRDTRSAEDDCRVPEHRGR